MLHIIWEPAKFKGRYGTENDVIDEIRNIFNRSEADIRRLLDKAGVRTAVSIYQIQIMVLYAFGRQSCDSGHQWLSRKILN